MRVLFVEAGDTLDGEFDLSGGAAVVPSKILVGSGDSYRQWSTWSLKENIESVYANFVGDGTYPSWNSHDEAK
jgi:hypothetical protein